MNDVKHLSISDAFKALDEIGDEEITIPSFQARRTMKLHEGKAFNINDSKEMEVADKLSKENLTKEVQLEVIDPDADSEEHLHSNDSYIGQRILQCNTCKAKRFVNQDDLEKNEDDMYTIKEHDDVHNECPSCHKEDTTYTSIGNCAAIEEPKEEEVPAEEPKLDNDSKEEEQVSFENNIEEQPEEQVEEEPEEIPAEEQKPAEEPVEGEYEEPEEEYEETEQADDTADMPNTAGDEVKEVIKADDTEEEPVVEEPEEEAEELPEEESEEKVEEPEEEEKEKKESLQEEVVTDDPFLVHEFFESYFPDIENVDPLISVIDDSGEVVLKAKLSELPAEVLDSEISKLGIEDKACTLHVETNALDEKDSLDRVAWRSDLDIKGIIDVMDDSIDELYFTGTFADVMEMFGSEILKSIETPRFITITINGEVDPEIATVVKSSGDLVSEIIKANDLNLDKLEDAKTTEYWIKDSIDNKEDLDVVFNKFVKPTENKELINRFKEETNFKTDFDEAFIKENGKLNPRGNVYSEEEAYENARKICRDSKAFAVIFGIGSGSNFKYLEPLICRDEEALRDKTEIVTLRYNPTSIRVVYGNDLDDPTMDKMEESFKTRKALSEAIKACKNNNEPYTVKRSIKEGYRYDLIKKPAKEEFKFDTNEFTEAINEYFTEAYGKGKCTYVTEACCKEENGDISVKGKVFGEDVESPIKFTIHEEEGKRIISNDLSEEVFEVEPEVEAEVPAEVKPEGFCVEEYARLVMSAYQNANKWLDSIKEVIYTKMSCPFFSSFVHELAHSMPARFDKFGDILHTVNMEIPYPETQEISRKPENITEAILDVISVLDGIKDALNKFIKCTDEEEHGMSCAAEALLNDIEGEYPFLFRLQAKAAECGDDTVTFDKFVGQYVQHKGELLENLNEGLTKEQKNSLNKIRKFAKENNYEINNLGTNLEEAEYPSTYGIEFLGPIELLLLVEDSGIICDYESDISDYWNTAEEFAQDYLNAVNEIQGNEFITGNKLEELIHEEMGISYPDGIREDQVKQVAEEILDLAAEASIDFNLEEAENILRSDYVVNESLNESNNIKRISESEAKKFNESVCPKCGKEICEEADASAYDAEDREEDRWDGICDGLKGILGYEITIFPGEDRLFIEGSDGKVYERGDRLEWESRRVFRYNFSRKTLEDVYGEGAIKEHEGSLEDLIDIDELESSVGIDEALDYISDEIYAMADVDKRMEYSTDSCSEIIDITLRGEQRLEALSRRGVKAIEEWPIGRKTCLKCGKEVCEHKDELPESLDDKHESLNESAEENNYADKAWMLNEIISSMNNEEAYYGGWLYIWPDGETVDECAADFGDEESYKELEDTFVKVYKAYHEDGLFNPSQEAEQAAHEWDKKLGLSPIEILRK